MTATPSVLAGAAATRNLSFAMTVRRPLARMRRESLSLAYRTASLVVGRRTPALLTCAPAIVFSSDDFPAPVGPTSSTSRGASMSARRGRTNPSRWLCSCCARAAAAEFAVGKASRRSASTASRSHRSTRSGESTDPHSTHGACALAFLWWVPDARRRVGREVTQVPAALHSGFRTPRSESSSSPS